MSGLKPGFLQHFDYLRQGLWIPVRLGCSIFIKCKIRADSEYLIASLADRISSIQGGMGAGQNQQRIEIVSFALEDFPGSGNRVPIPPAAVIGCCQAVFIITMVHIGVLISVIVNI